MGGGKDEALLTVKRKKEKAPSFLFYLPSLGLKNKGIYLQSLYLRAHQNMFSKGEKRHDILHNFFDQCFDESFLNS